MIDIDNEQLLTLEQAAKRLPGRDQGEAMSLCTVRRWARDGVRGRRLETVLIAGRRRTSTEAIRRFVLHLANDDDWGSASTVTAPARPPHPANSAAAAVRTDAANANALADLARHGVTA